MNPPDISVCVPCYERPDTVDRLIRSFLWQQDVDAELILSDDSPSDAVKAIVNQYAHDRVVYVRNLAPLGYCVNLKQALLKARSDLRVTLGDDDFFASPWSLSRYLEAFREDPELVFVYPNRLQVARNGDPDIAIRYFQADIKYSPGVPAWTNIWHVADCIAGIGFRATKHQISMIFPEGSILYPQTLLVGHLMGQGRSMGVAECLVVASAHADLLGYKVSNGQHIHGDEQHGTVEYLDMIPQVVRDPAEAREVEKSIGCQLAKSLAYTLPDEKYFCGREVAVGHALGLIRRNRAARGSVWLWSSLLVTILFPATLLRAAKTRLKRLLRRSQSEEWNRYERLMRELGMRP